ncbi:MAG: SET domain-containing protein [Candidatus Roizmanbacteria bacterium]|nr:SET domain-containing protein [Candidatus Roizmanbacteria bacterium]
MNKNKERMLRNLQHTYCRIQPSAIHGVGVFAMRDIAVGISVFDGASTSSGETLAREEIKTLPREVQQFLYDFLVSDEDGNVEVPPNGVVGLDMSFYLNHSDTPNLETHDHGETFVAKRAIKNGEELTVDYTTFDPHSAKFLPKGQ